jgi:hypothetical protein
VVHDPVNDRLVVFGGQRVSVHRVDARFDLDPDTLNLKGRGRWVTARIELPDGYHVGDIDLRTVGITRVGERAVVPPLICDQDFGGRIGVSERLTLTLMVKFDRQALIGLLEPPTDMAGDVVAADGTASPAEQRAGIVISGRMKNGIAFDGPDVIRVIGGKE